MLKSTVLNIALSCAALSCVVRIFGGTPQVGEAQTIACPESTDQVVVVTPGRPSVFNLNVKNLGAGQVTVFTYPLGGTLQPTGGSPLEFVFTPQYGFNGTTEFTYRILPPFDCERAVHLGRVTLVGGYADSTVVGLVPTLPPTICGLGTLVPLAVVSGAFLAAGMRRRRRSC